MLGSEENPLTSLLAICVISPCKVINNDIISHIVFILGYVNWLQKESVLKGDEV